MGEIEWNVGWKNGKSGVGWMPDDTIKNQRPRQMLRRLWKCVSDFVIEVLKSAEKTLGIYKLPLLVDAINDRGERRNHTLSGEGKAEFGMRNSEFGIRDGAAVPHTVARREAPLSEYGGRSYRSAIYAEQLPRPLRFMAGAANEALRIRPDCVRMVTSRARLRYMVECGPAARNQTSIASDRPFPRLTLIYG